MSRFRTCAARVCAPALIVAGLMSCALPSISAAATTYTPATPSLDGVLNGPWNTSQGDLTAGSPYYVPGGQTAALQPSLFPTYTPGGSTTTLGGVTEPNLAVYPTGTTGATVPYPTGVAGTPGPLPGYCSSGGANPESGAGASEPANTDLPMAPYYFPDVVRNSDGSLTGYFDWRPKDGDEAITVAKSTDGGRTWQTVGTALEQNAGYCPTADTNDDGQGHPYVASIGSSTDLDTLQRQAGDNPGVGLLVNHVSPSATNPLSTVPAVQPVGIDPNTFVTGATTVPSTGGVPVPVSTLGAAGSPEQIVNGSYEVVPAGNSEPASSTVITCTGPTTAPTPTAPATLSGPGSLTGCTSATGSAVSLNAGDDLIQVIATGNPTSNSGSRPCATGGSTTAAGPTIPAGPNIPVPSATAGGLTALCYTQPTTPVAPITDSLWGSLAPNRVYINGTNTAATANVGPQTVYCNGVSSGLVKLENCTTTGSAFNYTANSNITGDPIIPPGSTMTNGLIAPDGIVGTIPSYPGAPTASTTVLYTEKLLNYYIEGTTNGKISSSGTYSSSTITLPLTSGQLLNYQPSVTTSEPLPTSGSFTVYVGVKDAAGNFVQSLNCTGWTAATQSGVPAGSINLSGCVNQGTSAETIPAATDVGGPNAAIAPGSALALIGEGNTKPSAGPAALFGNNEDLTVLRAAYTTDGVNFTDLGPISGAGTENGASYNDISNPNQQLSPQNSANPTTGTTTPTAPTNIAPGNPDAVELRYVGSRGSIITNPDGSYGMFLSGAWSSDGDSDAFNQIFYSSSTDGEHWSVPTVVASTDYTFGASNAQDPTGSAPLNTALGISAYDSGRAYGPTIVQNPDGTLTMVFAGYRLPKPITTAGTVLGTNGGAQYTVGTTDPALYRNILTDTLTSSSSPLVGTSSALTATLTPGQTENQVTYTDTVSVPSPGTGIPTGTVNFSDNGHPISGCQNVALSESTPDLASCATNESGDSNNVVSAVYAGDSNYASSTGSPPAPPACRVLQTRRADPSQPWGGSNVDQQDVAVQAAGGLAAAGPSNSTTTGGLSNITITNGTVSNPSYTAGTTAQVTVTAAKVNQGVNTTFWSFDATDNFGQTTYCG